MKKIAAIVVTFNRKDLLLKCIFALLKQKTACDILIVDNYSTDGTENEILKLNNEHIKYRNTGKNIGGAGGFNFGLRWALEQNYDYFWLMDDDTIPQEDTLENLWKANNVLKENYGFVCSEVFWRDGTLCRMNKQKFKSLDTKPNFTSDNYFHVTQATFVSIFLPKQTIEKVGLPIKEFFIWGDDIEFTRRISVRLNMPCYLIKDSIVVHMMKDNGGSNIATDTKERITRYSYAFRNECFTYRKEGIKGVCYYLMKCGWNLTKIIVKSRSKKLYRIKILIGGIINGFSFNPKIETINNK